eukprot:Stramenopile-MAST_4_protein_1328
MNVLQNAIKDTAPSLGKERDRSVTGQDLVGKKIRYFIVTKYCQTQRCGLVVKYFPSHNLVDLVYEGDSNAKETLCLDSIDWTLEASHSKAFELRARLARMKMHRDAIDRIKRAKLLSGIPNHPESSSIATPAELMLKLLDGSFRQEDDKQIEIAKGHSKEEHHDGDVTSTSEEDSEEGPDDGSDETTDEETTIALEEERKARRSRYQSMNLLNPGDGHESATMHIHREQYVEDVMTSVPAVSFRKHSLEQLEVDRIARIEKHIFPIKPHAARTTSASQAAVRAKLARRSAALHIEKDFKRLQARQERVRMLKAFKQKKQRDAERAKLCTNRGIFLGRMFARCTYRRVFQALMRRVKKCRLPWLLYSITTNADAKRMHSRFCFWQSIAHQLRVGDADEASVAEETSKRFIRFSDPSVSFVPVFNTPKVLSHQPRTRALFRFSGYSGMFWNNEVEGYSPPMKIIVKRGNKCVGPSGYTQNAKTTDPPTKDAEYTDRATVTSRPPLRPKKAKPIRTRRKQKARVITQQRAERSEQNKIHVHDSRSKCFLRAHKNRNQG